MRKAPKGRWFSAPVNFHRSRRVTPACQIPEHLSITPPWLRHLAAASPCLPQAPPDCPPRKPSPGMEAALSRNRAKEPQNQSRLPHATDYCSKPSPGMEAASSRNLRQGTAEYRTRNSERRNEDSTVAILFPSKFCGSLLDILRFMHSSQSDMPVNGYSWHFYRSSSYVPQRDSVLTRMSVSNSAATRLLSSGQRRACPPLAGRRL